MTLSLVVVDRPSADFAAVFTRNAFPGAPVVVGRRRLDMPSLGAILVNNKVSNVRAPDGEAAAERVCAGVAHLLGLEPWQVFPSSTGVIGWRLPEEEMLAALPGAVAALSGGSALPVAEGIVTTDLYPKVRRVGLGAGSIVAFGKGAGMIEPNLATMLVYVLTDIAVPRATLRAMLARAVDASFNTISIDGEMSTSDTVAIVSSGAVPCVDLAEFEGALTRVCRELAGDIVRNGEGVRHVVRVRVVGAPDNAFARALGKSVVNAPLFKCAVAGNDPNVGRLVQAVGKHIGIHASGMDISRLRLLFGGVEIFADGVFRLDPEKEALLREHLRSAELYASKPDASGFFAPQVHFPPHERFVEIVIELGAGEGIAEVIGGDLTHEYVSENADYRS
ncbi:MAG: bifunctional ornithine acetyltransferase/N-acetylglutamate synthase [Puniceicoccales bacterium]|nr:bifunctional ornithine acetyltransferase/N-acetylglutamate synthase [Puniceicoccales bacterium]